MKILTVWGCKQCILQSSALCLGSTYPKHKAWSSQDFLLMKLSSSSDAIYSRNLRKSTVFWSAINRTFTFTLTISIGSISYKICSIELIFCCSCFAKTSVFVLIVENLVNQNSVSLPQIILVITQLINSLLNVCIFCVCQAYQSISYRNISSRFFFLSSISEWHNLQLSESDVFLKQMETQTYNLQTNN